MPGAQGEKVSHGTPTINCHKINNLKKKIISFMGPLSPEPRGLYPPSTALYTSDGTVQIVELFRDLNITVCNIYSFVSGIKAMYF